MRCRHCERRPGFDHQHGLCGRCYNITAIRRVYPLVVTVDQGIGVKKPSRQPKEPTRHMQGSEAKLIVLEQRAAAGEELWHPADGRPDNGL